MQLRYKDKVLITEGFYGGIQGVVIGEIKRYSYRGKPSYQYEVKIKGGDVVMVRENSLSLIK